MTSAKVGSVVEKKFSEKVGSGYMWVFTANPSELVEIKTKRDLSQAAVGGPVNLMASVRSLRAGKVTLTAAHIRPWLGLDSSLETVNEVYTVE